MPKVTPFLWFDTQAQEAAELYVSIFPNSKVTQSTPMVVTFTLDGQDVMALNGGPHFKFNEAVSFVIDCRDQAEVDYYWDRLLANGGQPSQCGWLKDRFGLSWQVVPEALRRLMGGPDRAAAGRVQAAMMKMVKLDVAALEAAAASG